MWNDSSPFKKRKDSEPLRALLFLWLHVANALQRLETRSELKDAHATHRTTRTQPPCGGRYMTQGGTDWRVLLASPAEEATTPVCRMLAFVLRALEDLDAGICRIFSVRDLQKCFAFRFKNVC